jgi:hypothetical protein
VVLGLLLTWAAFSHHSWPPDFVPAVLNLCDGAMLALPRSHGAALKTHALGRPSTQGGRPLCPSGSQSLRRCYAQACRVQREARLAFPNSALGRLSWQRAARFSCRFSISTQGARPPGIRRRLPVWNRRFCNSRAVVEETHPPYEVRRGQCSGSRTQRPCQALSIVGISPQPSPTRCLTTSRPPASCCRPMACVRR